MTTPPYFEDIVHLNGLRSIRKKLMEARQTLNLDAFNKGRLQAFPDVIQKLETLRETMSAELTILDTRIKEAAAKVATGDAAYDLEDE